MIDDEKLKKEVSEYVEKFVKDRFPGDMPTDLNMQIKEIVFDAFNDGAHWAEEQHVKTKKSRIILPGVH